MTRHELLSRMDSKEYAEWIAYDQLEPMGPYRDALLWATLHNAFRGKNDAAASIHDYPFIYEPKPELSDDELGAKIRSIFGIGGST